MVNPGWLAVYGKDLESGDTPTLAAVADGKAKTLDVEVRANQTKPPARFTEATLLSAMEGAGKLVEDEDLREAMSEKGLGTPATRASIIEGLLSEDYIHREARELVPTAKAFDLLYALTRFGIDELRSPELTGSWEFKLKEMEQGKLKRDEFMRHIEEMTRDFVDRIKHATTIDEPIQTLKGKCPKCGSVMIENYKKFACTKCEFSMWKVIASRRIEAEEAEALFVAKSIGPLQGFRSRLGRPFAAMIKLSDDFTIGLDFGQGGRDGDSTPVDFSGQTPVGPCPKCNSNVYEQDLSYVCEKFTGPDKSCDFRSGKIILQRPIEREQMVKLLTAGKTDLLQKFISKKGRPFNAFLIRKPDGNVGFEFAPRPPKKGAAGAAPGSEPAPVTQTGEVIELPVKKRAAKRVEKVADVEAPPVKKAAAAKSPTKRAAKKTTRRA